MPDRSDAQLAHRVRRINPSASRNSPQNYGKVKFSILVAIIPACGPQGRAKSENALE
jgi:hypothetical protein